MSRIDFQPATVQVRHIYRDDTSPHLLLGEGMSGTFDGINGDGGFISGSWQRNLILSADPGSFELVLPNAEGTDGRLHRDRFAVIADPFYAPGDEWIEIYQDGELRFVGTPVTWQNDGVKITLGGHDGYGLLGKARETAAGWVQKGPQDAIEQYARAWEILDAADFTRSNAPAGFSYINSVADPAGLRLDSSGGTSGLQCLSPIPSGRTSAAWRVEANITIQAWGTAEMLLYVGDLPYVAGASFHQLRISANLTPTNVGCQVGGTTTVYTLNNVDVTRDTRTATRYHLAIEGRGAWCYFYVNDELIAVMPVLTSSHTSYATLYLTTAPGVALVENVLVRRRAQFLAVQAPDLRVGGAPGSSGLLGSYYDDTTMPAGSEWLHRPARDPYQRRIDPKISFAGAGTWEPPGGNPLRMSVTWTGSIYLDLANHDYALYMAPGLVTTYLTAWVGRTEDADPYAYGAGIVNGGSLRSWLGSTVSGWYPILLHYGSTGTADVVEMSVLVDGVTPAIPGNTADPLAPLLAPQGIYDAYVRYDAHAAQIATVLAESALQARLEPRQLESGTFPGVLSVGPRVGRDTDYIVDQDTGTNLSGRGAADDVADSLTIDASGQAANIVSGDAEAVTIEAVSHNNATRHVFFHQDTGEAPDVTDRTQLITRTSALALLRSTMWEEVAATPRGLDELRDTFPLSGALSGFAWEPGDGVRLHLPDISIVDASPRQMTSVARSFVPGGVGPPTVAFRQRPRGLRADLRAIARTAALTQRASRPMLP